MGDDTTSEWLDLNRTKFSAWWRDKFAVNRADQKERNYTKPDPEQLAKARAGGRATARRSDAFRPKKVA